MEERLRIVLWAIGSGAFFALVGGVFGAAAGAMARRNGQASGGSIGRTVAAALARAREQKLPAVTEGAVIGGVEGASFLAVVGTLAGVALGFRGDVPPVAALAVAGGIVVLALVAALFGSIAYGMVRGGVLSLGMVCCVTLAGAVIGARVAGIDGALIGV